ncbi:MAG: Methyltransferase type 11 [Candidatus Magasanikbacteria bacterium]|nr:Methyltransferase type 11 [Candidatus Magasanikbacteria bacterium]
MAFASLYANYYDLFYGQKDYTGEVATLEILLKRFVEGSVHSILSIGCGTLGHELLLAKHGYKIFGIDQSTEMIAMAKEKISAGNATNIQVEVADMRSFNVPGTDALGTGRFDAAIAMFNIIGYCAKNEDLVATLRCVRAALRPGGIFVFDCWFAPAIFKDPPTDRVVEFQDGQRQIVRRAKTVQLVNDDLLEIEFTVAIKEGEKVISDWSERHRVRYWMVPELTYFLEQNGLALLAAHEFGNTEAPPSPEKWNMMIVARAV